MSEDGLALLAARARQLARPAEAPRDGADLRLVTFRLGGERYGIELRHVVEVFRLTHLAQVPGAAAPVFGITSWRGELLTLLDLRVILGVPAQRLDDLRIAVVLGDRRAPLAVLADSGEDLLAVSHDAVRALPEGVAVNREFVRGITAEAVVLLDAERLLERYGPEG